MLRTIGVIDTELLDSGICWLVMENMREMLAIGKEVDSLGQTEEPAEPARLPFVTKPSVLSDFIQKHTKLNHLIQVSTTDHFFIILPDSLDHSIVHLIEWGSPDKKSCRHINETMSIDDFIGYMIGIMLGTVPDRFYGKAEPQLIKLWAFKKKIMNAKVVYNYIAATAT